MMSLLQIQNDATAIFMIVLAVLIPIVVIFYTLRAFRRKRARGLEKRKEGFGQKFKSVKEERLEKNDKKNKESRN